MSADHQIDAINRVFDMFLSTLIKPDPYTEEDEEDDEVWFDPEFNDPVESPALILFFVLLLPAALSTWLLFFR